MRHSDLNMHDKTEIIVRRATVDDVNLLSVLGTVTFYEAYFEQDTPDDLTNYVLTSFSPAQIREQLIDDHSIFLIAFLNGKAVGYARLVSGIPHEGVKSPHPIELRRIYIVERVWGKGVGDFLLSEAEGLATQMGRTSVWLSVWQCNQRGQRFYEKHAYNKVGTVTFPYGDSVGINDVMEKFL